MNDDDATLDPVDADALRRLAHRMVDDSLDFLEGVESQPAWQPVPELVKKFFDAPPPRHGVGADAAYEEFVEYIRPYRLGNIHPRFWAWYMGNGTVTGALAAFLSAVMNSNVGGGNQGAAVVEHQVVEWLRQVIGLPPGSSGLLVSGGSMANFVALAVARNAGAGFDVRARGLAGAPAMTVYGSTELHSCNQKAAELLGFGSEQLRRIPVGDNFTIDLDALRRRIDEDVAAGLKPVCVIGSAGTVNTGAVDDLVALAGLCRERGLWFHVDGAIGAVAMLSESVRPHLEGIDRADSVALDLHKWMHVPFEAGCVLIRDGAAHFDTFNLTPEYLARDRDGVAGGGTWYADLGLQLSREFRALKVWMMIREHGFDAFGRMMDKNVAQARYVEKRIGEHPQLELCAPVGMDIVCFRYNPGGLDSARLDRLNRDIVLEIQRSGFAVPSYTTLNGRTCIRIAVSNHRSRLADFDGFVDAVLRIGAALAADHQLQE